VPEFPGVTSLIIASRYAAMPPFVCSWRPGGRNAAWVHVAGELDFATSPQLGRALGETCPNSRMVVLDLRALTFIDSAGIHVILDGAADAREEGHTLMLARGPAEVDRVFGLTGAADRLAIFDLDPTEPAPALRLSPGTAAA
jgi:anti-sigma B factor antagonist